ncbi:MAG: hypothetical protein R3359_08725 [Marinirhabdus sp.]|nr:hypothetical protein [Marinirhabdus sp.]
MIHSCINKSLATEPGVRIGLFYYGSEAQMFFGVNIYGPIIKKVWMMQSQLRSCLGKHYASF